MLLSSEQRIRRLLRERQEATRPQLAGASGISLVTVGKIIRKLLKQGEIIELGPIPSGGGRPVQLYRYQVDCATCALFETQKQNNQIYGTLEILNLQGQLRYKIEARFAQLHIYSLDGWLDEAQRKCPLQQVSLCFPTGEEITDLSRHLEQRYHCSVLNITPAVALADNREQTLTLCLLRNQKPTAAWRRHGILHPAGPLWRLPMPADWEKLPYDDHTLVEEMAARLTAILCCTMAPPRVVIYSDFWTQKLTARIRYNLSTKLPPRTLPALAFRNITTAELHSLNLRTAIHCC